MIYENIVHKVMFSWEAVFDYEHSVIVKFNPPCEEDVDWRTPTKYDLPKIKLHKTEIKNELEEYIHKHSKNKYKPYFSVKHYDEQLDKWLMLFVMRGTKVSIIQNWIVTGICFAENWTRDSEDRGIIRAWLETKINPARTRDWIEVTRERKRKEEKKEKRDEKERKYYERLLG